MHDVALYKCDPLIFKLQRNWSGEGCRVSRITRGFFVVVAPSGWERSGHAPVASEGCTDATFRAHYFHRDGSGTEGTPDGFDEWSNSPVAAGIELVGQRVFDDSDEGQLFGGAPNLKPLPGIVWARTGEETEDGWGQNFQPDQQSLPDVLGDRQGRFFLRVYDPGMNLVDSEAFRVSRDLNRICVDRETYTKDTVLLPTLEGYDPARVRFVAADGSTISPMLPSEASQAKSSSGEIEAPPRPESDRIQCSLESEAGSVEVVLDLPRIWWRLDGENSNSSEWNDKPLVMTREEFRQHAHSDASILLLSRRFNSVRVGFDDEPDQQYRRNAGDTQISIPLAHFVDHNEVARRLSEDAYLNVECSGKTMRPIVISADPMPEIISFISEPNAIDEGQETVLTWVTRNAESARVRIEPGIGNVESSGCLRVAPAESMTFTLRLGASGMDDSTRSVAVDVRTSQQGGDVTTPIQLLERVTEMQQGAFYEYYRGHLNRDLRREVARLRGATQFWNDKGVITLVQGKLENGRYAYFAVRTSNSIAPSSIEKARVLQVTQTPQDSP